MDSFYDSAFSLISSPEAKQAFDIEKEPAALRDAYGRNTAGSRMLLARRLVEAGVRLVNLTYGGWDMHDNIVANFNRQMPSFDQAFSQLILDLEQRGLLDSTLVMVSSEFGRTPKINGTAGRDHWPKVFSVVLAGGGIKKGRSTAPRTRRRANRKTTHWASKTCSRRSTIAWESWRTRN